MTDPQQIELGTTVHKRKGDLKKKNEDEDTPKPSKLKTVLFVVSMFFQFADVGTDIAVYNDIAFAEELECSGADTARQNLTSTTPPFISPFDVRSRTVSALINSYDNMTKLEQEGTCNPRVSAETLASEMYMNVADSFGRLKTASMVFIVISFVPFIVLCCLNLVKLQVMCRQICCKNQDNNNTAVVDTEQQEGHTFQLALFVTNMLVQVFEDIPQSLIAVLFLTTQFKKTGAHCNLCFRTEALDALVVHPVLSGTNGTNGTQCELLRLGGQPGEPFTWAALIDGTGSAVIISLVLCLVSVLKNGLTFFYFVFFREGCVPRTGGATDDYKKQGKCCGNCEECLMAPFFVVFWVVGAFVYFVAAMSPMAGAIYFYVGPELSYSEWDQSGHRQTSRGIVLVVFISGVVCWGCCIASVVFAAIKTAC